MAPPSPWILNGRKQSPQNFRQTIMNSKAELEEHIVTLRVAGDLISTNAETVRTEAESLLKSADAPLKWSVFSLDLTGAKMVDSVGLNLVVMRLYLGFIFNIGVIAISVGIIGRKMRVTYSNPNILRTFMFTRLDQQIELVKI